MTNNIFNDITQTKQTASSYSSVQKPIKVTDVVPSIPAASAVEEDSVNLSTDKQTKQKKGPIKAFKSFIAVIAKFFASFGQYFKGFFKGIKDAAIIGSLVYTAGSVINHFKSKAAEGAKKLPNKALAIVTAVAAMGINLWNASLNASEKRSDVEHRWTGHQK